MTPRRWLCLSALLPCLLDAACTLLGQPSAYWVGDHALAVEWNPLPRILLLAGPGIFALGVVVWAVGLYVILQRVPFSIAVVLAFGVAVMHGLGAGSWLLQYGWPGAVMAVSMLVLVDHCMSVCWRAAGIRREIP